MKKLVTILLLFSVSMSFAQDVIEKVNGDKIECKVIEIDEKTIKYRNPNDETGPLRSITKQWVYQITYENKTTEIFNKSGLVTEKRRGRDKKRYKREGILSRGFYIDGMLGIAMGSRKSNYYSYPYPSPSPMFESKVYSSVGARIGSKWYFGSNDKHRFGLNVSWLRFAVLLDENGPSDGVFSPLNLGLASVFQFKKNVGLEVNTYTGVSLIRGANPVNDIVLGLDAKFRHGILAVGLDYGVAFNPFGPGHTHLVNVVVGVKL
jgi:hypothetical protein